MRSQGEFPLFAWLLHVMRGVDTKLRATGGAALTPAVHERLLNAALAEVTGGVSGDITRGGWAGGADRGFVHADGAREWHGWRAATALAVLAKMNKNPAGLHVFVYKLLWEVRGRD